MCGIVGIYRPRSVKAADASRIGPMADLLLHRGPDDFGYLLMNSHSGDHILGQSTAAFPEGCNLLLANRRLAVIDTSEDGRMPMSDSSRTCFLTYNGEIFNYLELRDALQARGHAFRTGTDTEVILNAYLEWGDECVSRFNGMWAFALWDQRRRRLFCSRDRFGIKPFYYAWKPDGLVFGSEVKAILPALDEAPQPNEEVLHDFLVDRQICHRAETLFQGILRLPPAHNLAIGDGEPTLSRYWDYDTASHSYDLADPVGTMRDLFDDACALRLRSDVATGLALSGGLDSSSVLSSMRKRLPDARLHAFTAVFPGDPHDESRYTRIAAEHFGVELHTVEYEADNFVVDLGEAIWHMDSPAINYQPLPYLRVVREAKKHVTVLLEGQGSDEILAGYQDRYFLPHVLDEVRRAVRERSLPAATGAWRTCREIFQRSGHTPFVHAAARLSARTERLRLRRKLPRRGIARDFVAAYGGPKHRPLAAMTGDLLNDAMREEHGRTYLPWILSKGDAISMAAGVESRMPFLDHRLVEFAFRLPGHLKMRAGLTKTLLREAVGSRLPAPILARRDKIGFLAPAQKWIGQTLDDQVRPVLTSRRFRERGYFDPATIDALLQPTRLRHFYASDAIYQALSVELWMQTFIDGH